MRIRTALIAVALAIGVIIIVALFVFLRSPGGSAPLATTTPSGGLPVSGSVPVTGGFSGPSGTSSPGIAVANRGGGTAIAVQDFIHNGTTIEDPVNTGTYYLTGNSTQEFVIAYDSSAQFFTIALNQEPLGQARLDAERALETALGVPAEELCVLKYYVGTDEHTNSFYAGKNLGFSFCPSATPLPQ